MNKGWEIKHLGEVCEFQNGFAFKGNSFKETGMPILRISNIQNNEIDFDNLVFINLFDYKEDLSKYEIKKGDLLIAMSGGTTGKIGINNSDTKFYLNQRVGKFEPKKDLSKDFLYYFLSTKVEESLKISAGSAQPNLSTEQIKSFQIPLPPLPEQKRIVEILDEAFAVITKAKENTEKNLQNAKDLFESYVQSVFENPKDNWEKKKWGELCTFVRGPFGGSLKKSVFKEKGYVVYEQKHAIHDHFNQLRYFIDENKFNEMKRFEVRPGDIIMSCSGVTLGRVAIVPDNIQQGIINQALLKLTPLKGVSVHFLKYWLRSKSFQDIITKYSKGAAIPNVPSAKILKDILIPIPTLKEQNEVVHNIELFIDETKKLETLYQQKLNDLEELKKSILQKAFAGELNIGVAVKKAIESPKLISGISTTDLQAGLTVIALQKHLEKGKENTFHHVKAEKIINTAQYHLNIELDRTPVKDAAGPNDFVHAKKIESRAAKAGFYTVTKKDAGYYIYNLGNQSNKLAEKTKACLTENINTLNWLIDLMVPMTTEQAEIVATVYAAWNNLLIDGLPADDEAIVYEARENWHTKKLDIPRDKFFNAITWMRTQNLVPKGTGKKILSKPSPQKGKK